AGLARGPLPELGRQVRPAARGRRARRGRRQGPPGGRRRRPEDGDHPAAAGQCLIVRGGRPAGLSPRSRLIPPDPALGTRLILWHNGPVGSLAEAFGEPSRLSARPMNQTFPLRLVWPSLLLSALLLTVGVVSAWYLHRFQSRTSRTLDERVKAFRAAEELEI